MLDRLTRVDWATFALAAGKSVRWIADQLGPADPALTLRVYAHAIQDEESDLSFANFGDSKRLYPAPAELTESAKQRNSAKTLVGRQGLEPWTIGLKARPDAEQRRLLTSRALQGTAIGCNRLHW